MSSGFNYFDVHQTLLFSRVPLWDPPVSIRPDLLEAERQGDEDKFINIAREYAESVLIDAECREQERGDAMAHALVQRWRVFTEVTGDQKIAASLTIAWVMAMRQGNQ